MVVVIGGAVINPFVVVGGTGPSAVLEYFDSSMTATGESFAVAPASSGIAAVSASFGSWLTRTSQSSELLVMVTKANPSNAVVVYDTAGNRVGSQQDLPAEPKAYIPLDGGFFLVRPAFRTVEAIAVGETEQAIFIGDEDNSMISVLLPVRLAADLDADGRVDNRDVGLFAAQWLDSGCETPDWCGGCDIARQGTVDFADYAFLAGQFQ